MNYNHRKKFWLSDFCQITKKFAFVSFYYFYFFIYFLSVYILEFSIADVEKQELL